jgi:hypothetical protein
MRFMVMVKATGASEAGAMPSERLLADMGRYNEELAGFWLWQVPSVAASCPARRPGL